MAEVKQRKWLVKCEITVNATKVRSLRTRIVKGNDIAEVRTWVSQYAHARQGWVSALKVREIMDGGVLEETAIIITRDPDGEIKEAPLGLPAPFKTSPCTYKDDVDPLKDMVKVTFTFPSIKVIKEVTHDKDTG